MSVHPCEICGERSFVTMFQRDGHGFVRCRNCQLERIDPQPTDAELGAIYGQRYYDAWGLAEDAGAVGRLKRATFARGLKLLRGLPPGARVLDCGAATGLLMEAAAESGLEPYGVELSGFGAGKIACRFGAHHVFEGELSHAAFPDLGPRPFAAVTMYDFLEHVRDPRATLVAAHALLADGGALLICTPRTGSLSYRLMGRSWTHYKTEHLYYFNVRNLTALLTQCGFAVRGRHAAWKAVSLQYLAHQYEVYPNSLLSRLLHGIMPVVPAALQRRPLPALLGEMLLHAQST
jgi:SAM-dependent methyltransferase